MTPLSTAMSSKGKESFFQFFCLQDNEKSISSQFENTISLKFFSDPVFPCRLINSSCQRVESGIRSSVSFHSRHPRTGGSRPLTGAGRRSRLSAGRAVIHRLRSRWRTNAPPVPRAGAAVRGLRQRRQDGQDGQDGRCAGMGLAAAWQCGVTGATGSGATEATGATKATGATGGYWECSATSAMQRWLCYAGLSRRLCRREKVLI